MKGYVRAAGGRRGAALLALLAAAGLAACSTPMLVPHGGGLRAISVPEENYALFEVEVTEPGVYALEVVDRDPQSWQQRVAPASNLARLAVGLSGGLADTARSSVGTDAFDAFAGVIWSVYGRKPASTAATPATAAQAAAVPKPGGELGPRLMQSSERPVSDMGQRQPERARLEPGRYVIRVATGYGTVRTQARQVDVAMVRVAEGTGEPTGQRIGAVPAASGGIPPARTTSSEPPR